MSDAMPDVTSGTTDDPTPDSDGAADGSGSYHVRLDVFEGPFDLLLQLIARRKLDVSEVDLAEITGEFLAHLRLDDSEHGVAALDLDTATHFLVVAATLIELKAARLLPEPEREELEDLLAEVRDVLYARLLEYKAFRDASAVLRSRFEDNAGFAPRDVPLEPRFEELVPDTELSVDASGLAALAAAALAPKPEPHVSVAHIHAPTLTVRQAADRVLEQLLSAGERAAFGALVRGLPRPVRVVHFLALLELYKLGHVDLAQSEQFGALYVRRLDGGEKLDAIEGFGSARDAEAGKEATAGADPLEAVEAVEAGGAQ